MAKEKKTLKFQMMMAPGEAEVLDDWMFKNRIRSRAEAIRRLCQIGLSVSERSKVFDRTVEYFEKSADHIVAAQETLRGGLNRSDIVDVLLKALDEYNHFAANATDAIVEIHNINRVVKAAISTNDIDDVLEDMNYLRTLIKSSAPTALDDFIDYTKERDKD